MNYTATEFKQGLYKFTGMVDTYTIGQEVDVEVGTTIVRVKVTQKQNVICEGVRCLQKADYIGEVVK